jgi:hypothetical protein
MSQCNSKKRQVGAKALACGNLDLFYKLDNAI